MSLVLPKSLVRPVLLMAFLRAELFAWENQQQDSKAEHGRPLRSICLDFLYVHNIQCLKACLLKKSSYSALWSEVVKKI
jgi:hypothetical protein